MDALRLMGANIEAVGKHPNGSGYRLLDASCPFCGATIHKRNQEADARPAVVEQAVARNAKLNDHR